MQLLPPQRILTIFFIVFVFICKSYAQESVKTSINSNWQFYKEKLNPNNLALNKLKWENVNLPHSWNKDDVMDDEYGYYRGEAWYKKTLYINSDWKNKSVNIFFEGVNQVCEVYINKQYVGKHIGGYTAFSFSVSSFINFDKPNEVLIKVDNSHNDDIPPLSADFTFFGGIYRDVYLIASEQIHFDNDNYASSGVFVKPFNVNDLTADLGIKGKIVNDTKSSMDVKLSTDLIDASGRVVKSQNTFIKIYPNNKKDFNQIFQKINQPKLWSPDQPYLYQLICKISDLKSGKQLDVFTSSVGFRYFKFDPKEGFFLNGKPLKLLGANRHQDYKDLANALPDYLAQKDMELIKEMGGNFVRVAHYPQDPTILETCDKIGLLAMVETPEVNAITETDAFTDNSLTMQREMIRQNFNHPSVIIWAYMNEVLLRPKFEKGSERQETYFKNIAKLAQKLEDLTKSEDDSRYTLIPNHGDFELYNRVGLTKIPMLVGWNLYFGWYSGVFADLETFLAMHHQLLPDKPMIITEYGADADRRLRSKEPIKFDKTMDYAMEYHKHYLNAFQKLPYVAGATIWNLVEFSSEKRDESWPHMNYKGVISWDRKPKDAYYLYQAKLLKGPVLNIASKSWTNRTGVLKDDTDSTYVDKLEIFTNEPKVRLIVNGNDIGTKEVKNNSVIFDAAVKNGSNLIEVIGVENTTAKDCIKINYHLISSNLKSTKHPFTELKINLGDDRTFTDELVQQNWLPDKEYNINEWGHVGGEKYIIPGKQLLPYGSNKLIVGTEDDPIYQTQIQNLTDFNFDVPIGKYELTMHFAEVDSVYIKKQTNIIDNQAKDSQSDTGDRMFDVYVNEHLILQNLGTQTYLKPYTAVFFKNIVNVIDNKGIRIKFEAKKGVTILNALELKRIF